MTELKSVSKNAATIAPRMMTSANWLGLYTMVKKEVGRFLNVYTQTLVAPVITTLLFYVVFSFALGAGRPAIHDIPYLEFLAPGLVMMTMVQNAFANTSSSMVIAKVQGNIVDVLMPPLAPWELLLGYITGAVLRGLMIGVLASTVIMVFVHLQIVNIFAVVGFAVLGTIMLGLMGLIGGIWSEKFDHIAAVTNFIVTPLTFLSGTFYSIQKLPETWHFLAEYNPFFYMIDGFRSGFIGYADSNIVFGALFLIVINTVFGLTAWTMLRTGYRIKS